MAHHDKTLCGLCDLLANLVQEGALGTNQPTLQLQQVVFHIPTEVDVTIFIFFGKAQALTDVHMGGWCNAFNLGVQPKPPDC